MKLHELRPAHGSRTRSKRIGRGISAGQGKTSGRGQKGQGSRSSVGLPIGFEGGQMPLAMRLPKLRGFHNKWRKEYVVLNIGKLNRFESGAIVDGAALASAGLIAKPGARVKVLAAGEVKTPLTLRVHRISKAARLAVEAAGGNVELLEVAEAPKPETAAAEDRRRGRKVGQSEGAPE
ncbi:MAG: 50S ribosomal protein L15 [Candidatus Dormibacteraeota bacterium]|nr:50S ribosomal protein L15 [Candidatus Dormibacteraeota bacterium]